MPKYLLIINKLKIENWKLLGKWAKNLKNNALHFLQKESCLSDNWSEHVLQLLPPLYSTCLALDLWRPELDCMIKIKDAIYFILECLLPALPSCRYRPIAKPITPHPYLRRKIFKFWPFLGIFKAIFKIFSQFRASWALSFQALCRHASSSATAPYCSAALCLCLSATTLRRAYATDAICWVAKQIHI